MYLLLILTFVLGYALIAFEHPLRIDKAATAILTGALCWTLLMLGKSELLDPAVAGAGHAGDLVHFIDGELLTHIGEIAEILFFLLAAMTIVEVIDSHAGFEMLTERLNTRSKRKLLWIISLFTFFMSAVLDNLTTSIVMAALLKKLCDSREDLWFFGGMVVIAANAGGAWSPIGDVTTIMLWIGGQVSALSIVKSIFLPSVVCMVLPVGIASLRMKGEFAVSSATTGSGGHERVSPRERSLIFYLGIAALLFVPVFKSVTHLPPFVGILLSLGLLWIFTEIMHRNKPEDERRGLTVATIIRRIDTPSVLFFLGILLAVAALQVSGHLTDLAAVINSTFGNIYAINIVIGLLSAIVDNVPLVAGAMGMYPMSMYPADDLFWHLLAYCAGTGGSALIIGSAAGVAIMGLLKIDFIWYLKNVSWLAIIGYFGGVAVKFLIG